MHISKETIEDIAQLSRLEFQENEKAAFITQFENIIEYFNQLETFDLDGIEPLKSIMDTGENAFREDTILGTVSTADGLSNAPKHNGVFFKVPKVLGEKG
jgi:aspartyl-tRNA(Asn)/glutamyl-tRNA(Gln) amidotransferase subunit C